MEENSMKPKKSTVISLLAGAVFGAILGVMAYYGQWLG
ncbi:uncharacterized membrane protein (UPF0136 family) [Virgibacillus natechei]|uniref:Uncharacterized membrane protein (UPF0136 family) n=1 Tax=Virgibacillus natechei TaxID=1216297 RepID=A0ABS4IJ73_9BACI|nr:uncharacterized membrane protein (UPF0136 family) [Virgibacillus natechei]